MTQQSPAGIRSSVPEVLRSTELEEERPDGGSGWSGGGGRQDKHSPTEDECVLEEEADAWVGDRRVGDDVGCKEDPDGCDHRTEAQDEADEEPSASASLTHAAVRVALPPHLTVRDGVDPIERRRGTSYRRSREDQGLT